MAKWKVTRKWIKRLLWLTAFTYFPCWIFAVLQASLAFNLRSLYHAVVDLSFTTGLGFYLPYAFKITHILLALCVVGYVLYLRGNKEENVSFYDSAMNADSPSTNAKPSVPMYQPQGGQQPYNPFDEFSNSDFMI